MNIAIIITALSATLTAVLAFVVFKMRAGAGTPTADPAAAERMERMSQDMATERVADESRSASANRAKCL